MSTERSLWEQVRERPFVSTEKYNRPPTVQEIIDVVEKVKKGELLPFRTTLIYYNIRYGLSVAADGHIKLPNLRMEKLWNKQVEEEIKRRKQAAETQNQEA